MLRAVLTDLDGTVLEPDGSLCLEAKAALAVLAAAGVPVFPVTSKTAAELAPLLAELGLSTCAGCENGAVVRLADGSTELLPQAVPLDELIATLGAIRRRAGAPVRTLLELDDVELSTLTGLTGIALAHARQREATLPLVVDPRWDEELRNALPDRPRLRLVRGNRFLHLQGAHSKHDVVPRLIEATGDRTGPIVACGDAPNDAELLAQADIAVIVPAASGASPRLVEQVRHATVAPHPHGRGWAAALTALLARSEPRLLGRAQGNRLRGPAKA